MESLLLSFESIGPIFLLMLLGYGLKCAKVATKETFEAINKLVFKVFLPVLLFYNVYTTSLDQVFDVKLLLLVIVGVLTVFLVGYGAVHWLSKDNATRGVMLQGFFRSNFAILGVPLVGYICGDDTKGLASLMVAVVVPLFNGLAVVCLERFRNSRVRFGQLIKGVFTNPLIIGSLLGVVCLLLGIRLPSFAETAVADLAKVASPLAMVVLGAEFTFADLKGYRRELSITVATRLVIVPLLALIAGVWLGLRGEALACVLVTFGSPVAVSSFAMAQQMGGNGKLAAQLVVVSSAACLVTLFGWIFLLSYLQLL